MLPGRTALLRLLVPTALLLRLLRLLAGLALLRLAAPLRAALLPTLEVLLSLLAPALRLLTAAVLFLVGHEHAPYPRLKTLPPHPHDNNANIATHHCLAIKLYRIDQFTIQIDGRQRAKHDLDRLLNTARHPLRSDRRRLSLGETAKPAPCGPKSKQRGIAK